MFFEIIVLLLAIPVGFLIAWMARDELIEGKRYFRFLIIFSILGVIGGWLYGRSVEALTFGFIGIVSLVSFIKSEDKKWTKKRV